MEFSVVMVVICFAIIDGIAVGNSRQHGFGDVVICVSCC